MCGIAGAFCFGESSFRIEEAFITRMRETLAHRGPDGAASWVSPDGRVGLGHRRLAIIDLSEAANQPMANDDGSLRLVFNGEIYNHAELRAELTNLGRHRWQTSHSDTEVVLRAFEQWGIDCLERFRGMFAFALWDERNRRLWLARDRIGIKPLYYSVHHGRIVFGSEIKALLQDPDQQRQVDETSLFHYLSFLTTPGSQTLFDGIKKLPPGTWIRVDEQGQLHQHRYWDVWDHTEPLSDASDAEIAERLLDELRTSVELRKIGDVPVGVFLSGGIDSSTNAALFSEGESQPIHTFTIGYSRDYDSYRNENHFARSMAEHVGAAYHERLLTVDDLFSFLPAMIELQDEPIADPVCLPVYYVSHLARKNNVTVCQVGEGADELFWGYLGWKTAHQAQRYGNIPLPRILRRAGLGLLSAAGKDNNHWYEWLRRSSCGQPLFWGGAEAFAQRQKERLLSSRLRRRFAGLTSWSALEPIHDRYLQTAWEPSILHWMSYLDLNLRLPELLLMRVDKMSMGTSLECRVPFLDHKFVELAFSIPEAVKTRDGESKTILKQAVRGLIPDELIDRKKQGFGVPVYEWLFGRLGRAVRDTLSDFCRRTDFFDAEEVQRVVSTGDGPRVWCLFNLALWWQTFIAGESCDFTTADRRREAA